jgi:hypothetical protein
LILYTLCSFTWSFLQLLLSAEILAQPLATGFGAKGGIHACSQHDFWHQAPRIHVHTPLHFPHSCLSSRCISYFKVREDTKSEQTDVCPLSVCVPTHDSSHQCLYVRRSRLCGHPTIHRVHRMTASEPNYTTGWLLSSGLVWEIMIYINTRIKGQQ